MKRRSFIANVLASLGASPWISRGESVASAAVPAAVPRAYAFDHVALAGFQFHDGESVWASLAVGQLLDLVREPGNPHDANAIRVHWQGRMLGYVPRARNAQLAGLMDQGLSARARIAGLSRGPSPWDRMALDLSIGEGPVGAMVAVPRETESHSRRPGAPVRGEQGAVVPTGQVVDGRADECVRSTPATCRDVGPGQSSTASAKIAARIDGLRRQQDRVSRPFIEACARHGDEMVEALRPALVGPRPLVETEANRWLRRHAVTILGLVPTPSAEALKAELAEGPPVESWDGYRAIEGTEMG